MSTPQNIAKRAPFLLLFSNSYLFNYLIIMNYIEKNTLDMIQRYFLIHFYIGDLKDKTSEIDRQQLQHVLWILVITIEVLA
jgi:hypothetical protein